MLFSIYVCVATSEFLIKIPFLYDHVYIINYIKYIKMNISIFAHWKIHLKRDNLQRNPAHPVYYILDPSKASKTDTHTRHIYVQNIHIIEASIF